MSSLRFSFGQAIPSVGLAVLDSTAPGSGPVAHVYQRKGRKKNVIVLTQAGALVPEIAALDGVAHAVGGDALDALNAAVAPKFVPVVALGLVQQRWDKEPRPTHPRKVIEVAVLVRASSKEEAADELEALAERLRGKGRDGMMGYVGHGAGYHTTSAYAAVDLSEKQPG